MDERPFCHLDAAGSDVYMLFDYRELTAPPELDTLWARYSRIVLVAWSMGVWVGQQLFYPKRHLFEQAIAINGTLCPIDDRYGIPAVLFNDTLQNFNETSRQKFYRRMCRDKMLTEFFFANQPGRDIHGQREELAAFLHNVDCVHVAHSIYDHALVAEKDMIMPTANQLNFWQAGNTGIRRYVGGHYLFHQWSSWDDILVG